MSRGILISEGLLATGVLIHDVPPVGTLWLPLSKGLTVLYGRNGAGKSTILNAVRCALQGIAPSQGHVTLHLEFADWYGGWDESMFDDLERRIHRAMPGNLDGFLHSLHSLLGEEAEDRPADPSGESSDDQDGEDAELQWHLSRRETLRAELRESAGQLLSEGLCHSPHVALLARGSTSRPFWEPYLAVTPTSSETFVRYVSDRLNFSDPFVTSQLLDVLMIEGVGWREPALPVCLTSLPSEEQEGVPMIEESRMDAGQIACLVADDDIDLEAATLAVVVKEADQLDGQPVLYDSLAPVFTPSAKVSNTLDRLSRHSTDSFQMFTGAPAVIGASLLEPTAWLRNEVIRWTADDGYGSAFPIQELGSGQSRWARLAISLALATAITRSAGHHHRR